MTIYKLHNDSTALTNNEDTIIDQAVSILANRLKNNNQPFTDVATASRYAQLKISGLEHEVFCVFFLDTQARLLKFETLFTGTVHRCAVYPREVVKRAMNLNSSAVILAHNHPSGSVDPSRADRDITQQLVQALALIDVRVLDHIIVGSHDTTSFSNLGIMPSP